MVNKGLEVMEAYWMFGLEPEQIEVVIQPESIIHSAIELIDGAVLAQLGVPALAKLSVLLLQVFLYLQVQYPFLFLLLSLQE